MISVRPRFALLAALLTLIGAGHALAADHKVVLPLAGLAVDLPAKAGLDYVVSGSWLIDGITFEGGDTIDEVRAGEVVATSWISIGWFEVNGCLEVLRHAPIDDPWELPKVALWGGHWAVRGGTYRGAGEMKGRPIVTVCGERGERKQLVLSRFPIETGRTGETGKAGAPQRAELLREVHKSVVLRRIYRSFLADRTAVSAPARDARNRGEVAAMREVTMLWSEITFTLPDDGFVWVTGADLAGIDRFERMAPAVPELSVAVARVDAPMSCGEALALVGGEPSARTPTGLPTGWQPGPTSLGAQHRSLSACRAFRWGVLVVGVINASKALDYTPVAPLLEAIGAGATVDERSATATTSAPLGHIDHINHSGHIDPIGRRSRPVRVPLVTGAR